MNLHATTTFLQMSMRPGQESANNRATYRENSIAPSASTEESDYPKQSDDIWLTDEEEQLVSGYLPEVDPNYKSFLAEKFGSTGEREVVEAVDSDLDKVTVGDLSSFTPQLAHDLEHHLADSTDKPNALPDTVPEPENEESLEEIRGFVTEEEEDDYEGAKYRIENMKEFQDESGWDEGDEADEFGRADDDEGMDPLENA
ncbi:hypothetical protein BKA69DRAFT_1041531 [Paraphysoderma sedebokerense]|nr:hypothetical protein BKA69DRAFT_1041531 [Paraphysoderma sedebokerense]